MRVIKTSAIFNSNLGLNAGSLRYIAKHRRQVPLVSDSKLSDHKVSSSENLFLRYKTKDGHIN